MLFTYSFDKKTSKYYSKLSLLSNSNKFSTYDEKTVEKLDILTYHRMYEYNMKKEFYSYIRKKFYYYAVRKELCKYLQHGNTNIMKHCRNVAYLSFACAKFLERKYNIIFDYESLIIGAYLHDLFMYDWHEKSANHRLHGFSHPKTASKNAKNMCNITQKEQSIIESHMWPLTITKIPRSKEAFLVCFFDKYSAIKEIYKAWI